MTDHAIETRTQLHPVAETEHQTQELADMHLECEQVGFLNAMREMKVDLTRYPVAQYQHPDRSIRIEDGQAAQVHLHE